MKDDYSLPLTVGVVRTLIFFLAGIVPLVIFVLLAWNHQPLTAPLWEMIFFFYGGLLVAFSLAFGIAIPSARLAGMYDVVAETAAATTVIRPDIADVISPDDTHYATTAEDEFDHPVATPDHPHDGNFDSTRQMHVDQVNRVRAKLHWAPNTSPKG